MPERRRACGLNKGLFGLLRLVHVSDLRVCTSPDSHTETHTHTHFHGLACILAFRYDRPTYPLMIP